MVLISLIIYFRAIFTFYEENVIVYSYVGANFENSVILLNRSHHLSIVKSSHLYLYSAFYNTDCIEVASQ